MLAADLPQWLVWGAAFLFGALWGSFFNVAIYRWPRQMSVVTPPSHCPSCGTPVAWYRNVPIFAYLAMRGRTTCCKTKLTPRYLLIEATAALLCVAFAERIIVRADGMEEVLPLVLSTLAWFFFAGGLLVATFIDLEWMMIPDEVSLPGAALGLATVSLRGGDAADMALGAGAGYLIIQVLFVWGYEHLSGRRGMGEGDSKLLLFIGAFTGWKGAVFALVAGSMQGLVVAIGAKLTGRNVAPEEHLVESLEDCCEPGEDALGARCIDTEGAAAEVFLDEDLDSPAASTDSDSNAEDEAPRARIPFGPFLALGALEWVFFGDEILDWYLSLF
jgi:leader peptidase (prepilin peptidase)/N-methyltransferase